jgi:NADP-dependent 3-hydroxy acid dehydrogenase YdfG
MISIYGVKYEHMRKKELIPVVADVTNLASLIQVARRLESRLGTVDVLTNITGVTLFGTLEAEKPDG